MYHDCSVFVLASLPPGDRRPNRRLCGPPVWLTEWCTFMNHLVRFPNWRAAFCHPDIFIHAYKCHAVESLPPSKNWNSHRRFFRFLSLPLFLATLGQKVEYLKCSGKVCPHSLCAGVEARYKQPSVVRDKPQLNALITPSCCFQPWKFTYSSFKDGYPSAPQGLLLSVMARSSRKDNKEGKSCANKCGLIFLYCRKPCWVYPLFSFPAWFRHSGTLFTGSFAVLYDCAVYFNAVF